jgi:hypothetical protein
LLFDSKSTQGKFVIIVWSLFLLLGLGFSETLKAEGSKELAANGGNRAHLLSSAIAGEGIPFPTMGTVKVYAKVGERIYMGSSVIGAGKIVYRAPGGVTGSNLATEGIIANKNQEDFGPSITASDGGYTPYIITVGPGQEGVWEIDFISPNPAMNPRPVGGGNVHPGAVAANAAWTQNNNVSYVTAFDVSVRNVANIDFIKGRAYMNIFGGTIGGFNGFNGKFHVLTNDGYIYEVTNKGQAGYIFSFFSNNKGYRNGAGNPIYKSLNGATNPIPIQDPRQNDTATDFTHKLFFNSPNADLPQTAPAPAPTGSTWLRTPIKTLTVSDVVFEGTEGTPNKAGAFPLGGFIKFKTSELGSYIINIDINKNGSFTDAVDVRLEGATDPGGNNSVFWNGKNGIGANVTGNFVLPTNSINVSLRGGEVHFPFIDVESNFGGIEIKRVNGSGAPDFTVHWDDTDITGNNGTAPNPVKTLPQGENSQTNGHKYGVANANTGNYGDNKSIDTWAYLVSSPEIPFLNINFRESDLQVVSLNADKTTYCLGEEMTYTIVIRNNGPDHVTGAKFFFDYPSEFNITDISPLFSANEPGNAITSSQTGATQYTSTINLNNLATLTYTFKVKLATSPVGGVQTKASVMRPVDVTDPDATNPDNLPPTNPDDECNSGTVGCNNIRTHTGITFSGVQINIGANRSVVEGTGGITTMTFPVTLSQSSLCDISVNYVVGHNTTSAQDFLGNTSGTLIIAAGQTTGNIILEIATDNIVERSEEFNLTISNPSGVNTIDRATAVGTIINDDIGVINITKADGYEEGTVMAKYIFSFANGVTSDCDLEIDYKLSVNSARGNNVDYLGLETSTITIPAGQSSFTLELPVINDFIVEGNETIDIAEISSIRSIRPADGTLQIGYDIKNNPTVPTITIFDNDKATIRIDNSVMINEGDPGFTDFTFNLILDNETSGPFTLNFKTSDGTALISDNDYELLNRVVNFSGQPESVPVTVRVIGDHKIEASEYFNVLISDLSTNYNGNLTISQATSVGNIINDDSGILDITAVGTTEGAAAAQFVFTLRDGKVADTDIVINYTLTGKANGSGMDYDKPQTGTITLLKGQNVVRLYLNTYDDNLIEGTEDVILTVNSLSHPAISLPVNTQSLNILDINSALITVADVQVLEGNAGTSILRFKALLTGITDTDFTLPFTIQDVTTNAIDYTLVTTSPISFSPNLATQEISIAIEVNGDYDIEGHETLQLVLGTPSKTFNGGLNVQVAPAVGTILDDDSGQITVTATHGKEENEEPVVFTFAFPTGVTSVIPTVIDFTLAGSTAMPGEDYVAPVIYQVTIPAGQNSIPLSIPVINDEIIEGTQTIVLTPSPIIGNPGVTINTAAVVAQIEDNDTGTFTLTGPATAIEGEAGVTTVNYTIKLNKQIQTPIQLSYRTADVTALAGEDYNGVLNTYTFLPGLPEWEITVPVTIRGDKKIEANEDFRLILNPLLTDFGGLLTIATPFVETTIENDDQANIIITKIDGIEGSQNARFTIGFEDNYSTDVPLSIPYTLGGTALNGTDYTGIAAGTITLNPGQTAATLDLVVLDDNLVEDTETVILTLSNTSLPYGITFTKLQETLNIVDNDKAQINISNASVIEGSGADNYLVFDVALSGEEIQEPFSLTFSIADGTATVGQDYEIPASATLNFNGQSDRIKQIQILVKGDYTVEKDETLQVTLGTLSRNFEGHLTISNATATGTIINNDKAIISITPSNGNEEGEVAGSFVFNFLNGITSDEATTINFNLSGVAQVNDDFTVDPLKLTSITIPAGQTSATLTIDVINDAIIEGTEALTLTTTGIVSPYAPAAVTIANSPQTLQILDNDAAELLLTADSDVTEGPNGQFKTVKFKVKLTHATAYPFSVAYQFTDITATNGNDYLASNGTWSFLGNAGEEQEVTVTINGDYKIEGNESFRFQFSNPSNLYSGALSIPQNNHIFTIINDDTAQLSINKQDGEEGGDDGYFTISLPTGYTIDQPVQISYTLGGTAVAADYAALPGNIILPANTSSITIPIAIVNDNRVEGDEFVNITANIVTPIYGTSFVSNTSSLKIIDDDYGWVSINNVSANEGHDGEFTLSFDVTLDKETGATFDVNYSTANLTAIAGEDYEAKTNNSITFAGAAGETQHIEIKYFGDKKIEADETFNVILQSLNKTFNGHLAISTTEHTGTGTLVNDDSAVVNVQVTNGSENGTKGIFRFYLENAASSDKDIILTYTPGGSALNIPAEKDYDISHPSTITIPAGQPYADVELTIVDDAIVEGTETVELLNLQLFSDHSGVTLSSTINAVLNIADNDIATLQLAGPPDVSEGADGTTKIVTFNVVLSNPTQNPVTINYATADGTATIANNDYEPKTGQLVFAGETAGETESVSVTINGDQIIEADELFSLILSNLNNDYGGLLTVPNTTATAKILNDDLGNITITSADGTEGLMDASFTFSFPAGVRSDKPVTIDYILGGSAGAGVDYTGSLTGTIIIQAGQNSVTLPLPVINDTRVEGTETVTLTGTINTAAYGISITNTTPTTLNIFDNDVASISISDAAITEGNSGTKTLNFNVTLTNETQGFFSVPYSTANGTATAGEDYVEVQPAQNLIFEGTGGEVQQISITLNSDRKIENDETLTVTLGTPLNNFGGQLTILDGSATGTILNDDLGQITIIPSNGNETGEVPGTFIFRLPSGITVDRDIEIAYDLAGSATLGDDYTDAAGGAITIFAGDNQAILTLPVDDDNLVENTENIVLTTTSVSGPYAFLTVANSPQSLNILDNDVSELRLTGPPDVLEGADGTTQTVTFTVALDKATKGNFTIDYTTANLSAIAGEDYELKNGTLTFDGTANQVQTISITIKGDNKIEISELFNLVLSNLSNNFGGLLTVPNATATATILNDDLGNISITSSDGTEGLQDASFTFSFPPGITSDKPTTINFGLGGGTATAADYTANPSTTAITIPAGQNSITLDIEVTNDLVTEFTETVILNATTVSNPYGIALDNTSKTLNIFDNDAATLTVSAPAPFNEGDSGTNDVQFIVTLTGQTGEPFTVAYHTVAQTAADGEDFVATSGTLNFGSQANQSQTVNVTIKGDKKVEADELFNLVLDNLSKTFEGSLSIAVNAATATILNDDSAVIKMTTENGSEDGINGKIRFAFENGASFDQPTVLTYTLEGTANTGSGIDYTADFPTTITIPAGSNFAEIDLAVNNDDIIEDTEMVEIINLVIASANANVTLAADRPVVEIIDNDSARLQLLGPASVVEGDSGITELIYTVELNKATTKGFSINYATADISAIANGDYVSISNTLNFAGNAGETQTFSVFVNGDVIVEANEAFSIELSGLSDNFNNQLTVLGSPFLVNIIDDDNDNINIISILDGEEGGDDGQFVFSLPAGKTVDIPLTISYTLGGLSTNGTDYALLSGTFVLPAFTNSFPLAIPVINDEIVEGTETVTINASVATNAYNIGINNPIETLNIIDNDVATISILPVAKTELDSGESLLTFSVSLDKNTQEPFTLTYDTSNGTAIAGEDFVAPANGALISFQGNVIDAITPKEVQTISILIKGDTKIEADEWFNLALGTLSEDFDSRINIPVKTVRGTIENDDSPEITVTKQDGKEGEDDAAFIFSFPNGITSDTETVLNFTLGGTALGGAVDYETPSASTITIPAGATSATLILEVNDDEIVEDTETVVLQNLALGTTYPGITLNPVLPIINIADNDDASLALSGPTNIPEGDLSTSEHVYTVTLNKATAGSFRLDYSTANHTATVADNDYGSAAGFLDFTGSAGETKTFKVFVIGDQKIEANEVFRVLLSNLNKNFNNRLTIASPQTEVTIVNDDGGNITITSQNGAEPNVNGRFIFSLPNGISSDKDILIDYSLDGSADQGQDYQATTGTITLPAKTNSVALPILVINDDKVEGTETVIINATIQNPVNTIALQNSTSSLEIVDDDSGTISINNVSVTEKNDGNHTLTFEVTLDKETEEPFTLSYSTADGTATAGEDYVAVLNEMLNFAGSTAGEVRQIAITYKGDTKVEANEIFNLILGSLSDNFGGRLKVSPTQGTGTATLENDDSALISVNAIDGSENGTKGVFRFGFEGGASADKAITFEYNLSGTASANDYSTTHPTTITIPAGESFVDLELIINNDEIVEGTETVRLENLQIVTAYSGITLPATLPDLNIEDNDVAELLLSGPHNVTEGDNGTRYIDFTLRLDKATAGQFTVSYTTANGTATTANNDYVPQSSAFTFLGEKDETKMIRILVNGDQVIEPDELFNLTLGNPSKTFENRLTIPVQTTTGSIINDDLAEIVITKQDGAEGGQPARFTFTLANNKTVDEDIYINYTLDNISAIAGTDFTVSAPSPLLLEKGSNSVTLTLAVNDDNIIEGTETVKITAQTQNNPRNNIIISNTTETLNITDNDQAVLVITNPQVLEGNSGETNLVFTVSINKPAQRPFTVSYKTEDISATAGEDYISVANGLVTFPVLSVTPQTITIKVKGDQKLENDETLKVLLTALSEDFGGKLSLPLAAATGKIINDDAAVITITGTNGQETNETPGTFKFSLPNNVQSDQPIKINYTLGGEALGNGVDYSNALSGFVTIPANASEVILNINVKEDNILEYDESVILNASIDNSSAYSGQVSLSNITRTILIEDNDSATLTLSGATQIPEGDDGFKPVVYTVTLSNPVTAGFKVNYNVEEISALISDEDFQFLPGELQFTGLQANSQTFTIYVRGDKKIEVNETFRITLTPDKTFGNRLTVQGAPLVVAITNDDSGIITITKEDGEEIADNSKPAKFIFSLPDGISSDQDITLPYSLSVNSARGEGVDYTGNLTGSITIYKNDNQAVFTLPVIDDNIVENTETVTLQLGNVTLPHGITIPETSRTLQIFDNDEAQLSISNATVVEGNSGISYLDFTIGLDKAVQESFTINYHTEDGTATAGEDYQAINPLNGSLIFNALEVAPKNIRVYVNPDLRIEANETLQLVLQTLSNNFGGKLKLPQAAGVGTIENDDSAVITISGSNGKEAGEIPGTFKFSLPANVTSDHPIKINYTLGGVALANGVDYTNPLSGELIIPANAPDATLNINVKDDNIVEFNESVIITASIANESVYYPAHISLGNTTHTIHIEDNDTATLSIDGPKSIVEGDSGTKTLTFNVTLSHPVASSFTIKYHSVDGTAKIADNDYQPVAGTLSFAGQNVNETYPIQITINGDTKIEGNEYFELLLDPLTQNYGGKVSITGSPARAIIQDDDNANINKVITITKQDGEEGVKDASFTFSFPPGVTLDTDTEIFFSLAGNAIKDADYEVIGSSGSIVIPAGQNSKILNLKVFDDTILEGTEDLKIITANIINSLYQDITISNPTYALDIVDNDNGTITIDAVSITEGNANTKEMVFNVVLSNETSREFKLEYFTEDGTATIVNQDYIAIPDGIMALGPQAATKQIKVLIKGDINIEKDEIFNLVFKPLADDFSGRLTIMNQTAAGKIINDDTSVITITKTDGEEGVGPVRFKFSFPENVFSDELTKIDYNLAGSAIANLDYNGNAAGSIEILPYQNSAELVLPVIDDNLIEGTETVEISASAISVYGSAISINPSFPIATIKDNDSAKLKINGPITVTEGNIGTTPVNFTVTLEGNIGENFDVRYSTQNGSATVADNDYIPKTDQILNFSGDPGELKTITIFANGDRNIEANENFFVNLHSLSKNFNGLLTIENSTAEAIILDDDNNPANKSITITKTNGSEVDLSPVTFTFSFPAGVVSDAITTIPYSLSGAAEGNGVDYDGVIFGNIAIPAGENSITLTLPVKTDAITEGTEIVKLTTGEVTNESYNGIRVVNAIIEAEIEDANTTSLTIDDVEIVEGNTGTSTVTFKLKLNGATARPFTVDFQTANGTATADDFDYTARSGKLSFKGVAANEEQEVVITIIGDKKLEADETFKLLLNNIQSNFDGRLVLDRTEATATIKNDDNLLITVTGTNGAEAGRVAGRFIFSLPLGYTSDVPTLINYTLGGQATAGGTDYEGNINGVIAIPAGEERVILSLPVIDDEIIEKDETIGITINSINTNYPNNITYNPIIPIIKIIDNDATVLRLSNAVQLKEGNSGTTPFEYTLTLEKATGTGFTVKYDTEDGTATLADNDYNRAEGSLSFSGTAGESHTITVFVNGDLKIEGNELFKFKVFDLDSTFNNRLTIPVTSVNGVIENDDSSLITITKVDGIEGTQNGKFDVTLDPGVTSDKDITVSYRLGGTATSSDYMANPSATTVTIPAGQGSASISIDVVDDDVLEEIETVVLNVLNISNPYQNVTVKLPVPILNIYDNDITKLAIISPVEIQEGHSGVKSVTFTLKLENTTDKGFTVQYATIDGSATEADNDYQKKTGSLSFAGFEGETKTVTVLINGDTRPESHEFFGMKISNPLPDFDGKLLLDTNGRATILNDDIAPVAADDLITIVEDTPETFSVITNDSHAEGIDPATITITVVPAHGVLVPHPDGTVTYSPEFNFFGNDSFTYTVRDIFGRYSNEARVNIIVTPVNDAPIANDDVYYVQRDSSIRENVSLNDEDPDGDVLVFRRISNPEYGNITLFDSNDGSFIYVPEEGFKGIDRFTYYVQDPEGLRDTAEVLLYIQPKIRVDLTPNTGILIEGDTISITAKLSEFIYQDVNVVLNFGGTAELNKDYTLSGNYDVITIPARDTLTTQKFSINSLKDYLKEEDETVEVNMIAVDPSAFVEIGQGADIIISDFYPGDKPLDPDENGDINPDPYMSPNGDGLGNEKFVIYNIERYPDNEVIIYNRWGNEVYTTKGYDNKDNAFNGTSNKGMLANSNSPLVDGVYYFIIKTKGADGKPKRNKGYVIIRR